VGSPDASGAHGTLSRVTVYNIRITSDRTRKQLGEGEGYESPFEAGRAAAEAYAVLIGRDGHDADDLGLHGIAVEDGEPRPFTKAEESAMVSALEQFMAEIQQRFGAG